MRSFFKMFFASLLSIVVFFVLCIFVLIAAVARLTTKDQPDIRSKSILVINLSETFHERKQDNPLGALSGTGDSPGLYDVIRLVKNAKDDDDISGIYIEGDANANGFASSNELRNAILDFRKSKKFVIAYGDMMSQGSYFVASAADRIYVNPQGAFEWKGYAITLVFVKEMLDRLDIQPQIFYAGKFKSATEMFRTSQMTPENRLQTTVWLNELYNYFLVQTGASRNIDTATLHKLASAAAIQTPEDAVREHLIDGVKYDDEIKAEFKQRLNIGKTDKLNLVPVNKYFESVYMKRSGRDRIAVIYAEGNIVDGMGSNDNIGGDNYIRIIRKARLDNSVKAIVLRVNSGGGSALASEKIWRELHMARQDGKPVVVSFGDVAASGGYYISCGADSIFSSPNTITGSIGVFGIIPNMSGFFKNKLGITFDGVKTAPYADAGAIYRPMNDIEKKQAQNSVDRIYTQFKQRVAEGRKKDTAYIDSIAQGRVWSGSDAIRIGLVDRIGSLHDAIRSAAAMAKVSTFGLKEYPETGNWLDDLLQRKKDEPEALIREQVGENQYKLFREILRIKEMTESVQTRMPFEFYIQ
jgi:protease-4